MTHTLWKSPATPAELNALGKNTATELLGIAVTEVGSDYLSGSLPVRTQQPMGLVPGGVELVQVETLGSMALNRAVIPHGRA